MTPFVNAYKPIYLYFSRIDFNENINKRPSVYQPVTLPKAFNLPEAK